MAGPNKAGSSGTATHRAALPDLPRPQDVSTSLAGGTRGERRRVSESRSVVSQRIFLPTISIAPANEIPMTGKNYNSEQPTFVGANWGRR